MASPHVAAAIALVLSSGSGTPENAVENLAHTATALEISGMGHGIPNISAALKWTQVIEPCTRGLAASAITIALLWGGTSMNAMISLFLGVIIAFWSTAGLEPFVALGLLSSLPLSELKQPLMGAHITHPLLLLACGVIVSVLSIGLNRFQSLAIGVLAGTCASIGFGIADKQMEIAQISGLLLIPALCLCALVVRHSIHTVET